MIKLTEAQVYLLGYFAKQWGVNPHQRTTRATYRALERHGYIMSSEEFPFHRASAEGLEALRMHLDSPDQIRPAARAARTAGNGDNALRTMIGYYGRKNWASSTERGGYAQALIDLAMLVRGCGYDEAEEWVGEQVQEHRALLG